MEVLPYCYNREEESLGDEDEIAIGEDNFIQYAKKSTEDEKLVDYECNGHDASRASLDAHGDHLECSLRILRLFLMLIWTKSTLV